jgi:hypothetical protein
MAVTEEQNPFIGNRRQYNDVNGIPLRTIAMQRLTIVVLTFGLSVLALCLVVMIVVAQNRPIYAFGFDRIRVRDSKTNSIVTESAVPINIQPMGAANEDLHETAASYWLPIYIENLYGVISDQEQQQRVLLRYVRPFTCPGSQAVTEVTNLLKTYNPIERAQFGTVVITADPIPSPRAPNQYHVTWTAATYAADHTLTKQQTAGALITIAWIKPEPAFIRINGQQIIGGNPVGMCVSQIFEDRASDPRATGVP